MTVLQAAPRVAPDRAQGPLPVLLVALTVVTGLVDAFSYLSLGHVFVANMTGNVIFLGLALSGVGGISIAASLLAVVAFALGAAAGGRWGTGREVHRGRLLALATSVQAAVVLVAGVLATTAGTTGLAARLVLIGLLALAMGGQNAVARRLAVPDLTTTVLTLTVTGLVADSTSASVRVRRLIVGPVDARRRAGGRPAAALGLSGRAALAGGSAAGRLRGGRPRGDRPRWRRGLAVAMI